MRLMRAVCAALFVPGLMTSVLLAHHSLIKEFDQTKAVSIQGAITKVDWDGHTIRLPFSAALAAPIG